MASWLIAPTIVRNQIPPGTPVRDQIGSNQPESKPNSARLIADAAPGYPRKVAQARWSCSHAAEDRRVRRSGPSYYAFARVYKAKQLILLSCPFDTCRDVKNAERDGNLKTSGQTDGLSSPGGPSGRHPFCFAADTQDDQAL